MKLKHEVNGAEETRVDIDISIDEDHPTLSKSLMFHSTR